ncbi:MAG: hypothetical protein ABII90_14845 [Bacteroidota bacterium]
MAKMIETNTIIGLYVQYRQNLAKQDQFPFAVRRNDWTEDFHVIVENCTIEPLPNGTVSGIPTKNGQHYRLFYPRPDHNILKCNEKIWNYIDNVDLSYYKNYAAAIIYDVHDRPKWGRYAGFSIEEICQIASSYIEWCIDNLTTNFCLSDKAIDYLTKKGVEFSQNIINLNKLKQAWFKSDLDDDLIPDIYRERCSDDSIDTDSIDPNDQETFYMANDQIDERIKELEKRRK